MFRLLPGPTTRLKPLTSPETANEISVTAKPRPVFNWACCRSAGICRTDFVWHGFFLCGSPLLLPPPELPDWLPQLPAMTLKPAPSLKNGKQSGSGPYGSGPNPGAQPPLPLGSPPPKKPKGPKSPRPDPAPPNPPPPSPGNRPPSPAPPSPPSSPPKPPPQPAKVYWQGGGPPQPDGGRASASEESEASDGPPPQVGPLEKNSGLRLSSVVQLGMSPEGSLSMTGMLRT